MIRASLLPTDLDYFTLLATHPNQLLSLSGSSPTTTASVSLSSSTLEFVAYALPNLQVSSEVGEIDDKAADTSLPSSRMLDEDCLSVLADNLAFGSPSFASILEQGHTAFIVSEVSDLHPLSQHSVFL